MNEQTPQDRLSAFYDGQVSSAEGDAVSRELEKSAEARRELAEYEQLSALLHELPQDRLSDEFRAEVMQNAERSMLLPAAEELTSPRRVRTLRGRWWQGAAALAASAAMLLVVVSLLDSSPPANQQAAREASETASAKISSSERASDSHHDHTATADTPVMTAGRIDTTLSAGSENRATSESSNGSEGLPSLETGDIGGAGGGGRFLKSGTVHDGAGFPSLSNSAGVEGGRRREELLFETAAPRKSRLSFDQDLKDANVGDVVEAFDRSGERISVVRLTVVDRMAGLEHLQVLLARNSIPIVATPADEVQEDSSVATKAEDSKSDESALSRKRQDKSSREYDAAGDKLVCVLVNAPSLQLQTALLQLKEQSEFQELSVEDHPIELAMLDRYLTESLDIDSMGRLNAPTVSSTRPPAVAGEAEKIAESSPSKPRRGKRAPQPNSSSVRKPLAKQPEKKQSGTVNDHIQPNSDLDAITPVQQMQIALPKRLLSKLEETLPLDVVSGKNLPAQEGDSRKLSRPAVVEHPQEQNADKDRSAANEQSASGQTAQRQITDHLSNRQRVLDSSAPVRVLLVLVERKAPVGAGGQPKLKTRAKPGS